MKKILALFSLLFVMTACGPEQLEEGKPVYVTVSTNMGDVTVMLYDDTPLHRDNFIKLCQDNAYEGVLFHRVIKEFVVQGGDPNSKAHEPGALYGDGDGGYTVPAEILSNHFNKRGALIDAKEGDEVNPERESAGTQFCFIQGKVWNDEELDGIEKRINNTRRNWLYYVFQSRLKKQHPELADEENHRLYDIPDDVLPESPSVAIAPKYLQASKMSACAVHRYSPHQPVRDVVSSTDSERRLSRPAAIPALPSFLQRRYFRPRSVTSVFYND